MWTYACFPEKNRSESYRTYFWENMHRLYCESATTCFPICKNALFFFLPWLSCSFSSPAAKIIHKRYSRVLHEEKDKQLSLVIKNKQALGSQDRGVSPFERAIRWNSKFSAVQASTPSLDHSFCHESCKLSLIKIKSRNKSGVHIKHERPSKQCNMHYAWQTEDIFIKPTVE